VENLNYLGPIPKNSYYGANEMKEEEKKEFLVRYENQRSKPFDNKRVLVNLLPRGRHPIKAGLSGFRREFMQIDHIDVFVEAITIASDFNKVLRKRFLMPETIGLFPTGVYTSNNMYRKKAMIWLMHTEKTDDVTIKHGRNGREYSLPELPNFIVDDYCSKTNKI